MNTKLSNILIQSNVVTKENCNKLIEFAKSSEKEKASVFDEKKANSNREGASIQNDEVRDVEIANIVPISKDLHHLLFKITTDIINPFYDFEIRDSEAPQLLCYGPGGHYNPHIDAESLWINPDGSHLWKKSIDRDLSTILFLNDDFEGGDLYFPDLKIKISPEPGLLVCFPSSRWFVHGVEPVISGNRYTLVSWMRVKGFKTKEEQDKEISDKYGIDVY